MGVLRKRRRISLPSPRAHPPRQPARLLRRRRPRHRDRRARARALRTAGLRAPRDRAQPPRRRRPARQGRGLRRGPARGAARLAARVQRPRRLARGAAGGRGAGPARDRRHLPARHEGPRRGRSASRGAATRSCSSATPATSRSRAPWATRRARIRLVETVEDVAALPRGRRIRAPRGPHPDDALGRRHARGDGRAARALPERPAAAQGRHLLRDPEPPERREGAGGRGASSCSSSARPSPRTATGWSRSPARPGGRRTSCRRAADIDPAWLAGVALRRRHRRRLGAGGARRARWSSACAPSPAATRASSRCPQIDEGVVFQLPSELREEARQQAR